MELSYYSWILPLIPEGFVLFSVFAVMLMGLFSKRTNSQREECYIFTVLACVVAAVLTLFLQIGASDALFDNMLIIDAFGAIIKITVLFTTIVVLVYSRNYLRDRSLLKAEFFILILSSVFASMILISAYSLLTVYFGVELLSLSMYSLIIYCRQNQPNTKTGLKYFLMGAAATALLLVGIAIVYSITNAFELIQIRSFLFNAGIIDNNMIIAIILMIAAVAVKFGAVPFHFWVPDIYKGTSTSVTFFVSTMPKIAAFAVAIRLFMEGFFAVSADLKMMFAVLAIISAVIGTVLPLFEENLKKMLGYAALGHIGFIILGFIAGKDGDPKGYESSMFYVITYAIMIAGAYGVIIFINKNGEESGRIDEYRGLHKRNLWCGVILLLVMLSMAGFPGTAGFYAKFMVIHGVIDAGLNWLAYTFIAFAVLTAMPFFRVIKVIYFDKPEEEREYQSSRDFRILLGVNSLLLLGFGVYPAGLISICSAAL